MLNFLCPTEEMIGMEGAISLIADTRGNTAPLRNPIVTDRTVMTVTSTIKKSQNRSQGKDPLIETEVILIKVKGIIAEKIPSKREATTTLRNHHRRPIKYPMRCTNSKTTWICMRKTIAFRRRSMNLLMIMASFSRAGPWILLMKRWWLLRRKIASGLVRSSPGKRRSAISPNKRRRMWPGWIPRAQMG